MLLRTLQLAASSVLVLACLYLVSQITPKPESNRCRVVLQIRWMKTFHSLRETLNIADQLEVGLRNLIYHISLAADFDPLVLE